MKKLIIIFIFILTSCVASKKCYTQIFAHKGYEYNIQKLFKNQLKFSTVYAAVNGGTSVSDLKTFSVTSGKLKEGILKTPLGIRKIARFGYENKATNFYDGTEESWSDNATVGKVKGFEYLFEVDYSRQQGVDYIDHHHFIRYSSDDDCEGPLCLNHFAAKVEYLKDGFADVEYFELSERYRIKKTSDLSFSIGAAHRLAEPYGYDPLEEWMLNNGSLHYTHLAILEGYTVDVYANEYKDPSGNIVATNAEVWKAVVIPEVLANYSQRKRLELKKQIQHSIVLGFDYYKYNKNTWLHAWGNLMPYHYNDGSEFSYHNYIKDDQWYDYSGGLIYGIKVNKNLGYFIEGKYNKYWNREWYDFKLGINYIIF